MMANDAGAEGGCSCCYGLPDRAPIDSPETLRLTIETVRDLVSLGVLLEDREYWPQHEVRLAMTSPFPELPSGGPWDDILVYYFRCAACLRLYRLSAETYHGSGGAFEVAALAPG